VSTLKVDTITKADGTGSLSVPAESGTVVTTASPSLGRRNLIINGAMQVAQRGTSETGVTASGYYTVDRWLYSTGGEETVTIEQSTDAPSGFGLSYKTTITTADGTLDSSDYATINQRIEGQNLQGIAKGTSDAKPLTVSFWVKGSATGTYICELYDGDNTRQVSASYTIDSANTWEYKTITFPADTSGSFDNDSNASLYVQFVLAGGSSFTSGTLNTSWASSTNANRWVGQTNLIGTLNATFQITGVQLEVGSVATPFEHRSYGEELALCQRYFYDTRDLQQSTNGTNNYMELQGTRHAFADVVGYRGQTFTHPVVMRTNPTVTFYNPNNSMTSGQVQFYAADGSTQNFNAGLFVKKYAMYFWAYTGVTVGSTGQSVVCNVHWMADAEL